MMRRLASETLSMRFSARRPTKNQISSPPSAHHAEREHQRAAHDDAEALRLAEVAADQHDHLVGQAREPARSPRAGVVAAWRRLRRSASARAARDAFAIALVGERPLGPAFDRRARRAPGSRRCRSGCGRWRRRSDRGWRRAGATRCSIDAHQQRQAAALIGAVEPLHFLVDRLHASARSACAPTATSCRRRAAPRRARRA